MDLFSYTLLHGACKLERRFLSKKMLYNHWTILNNLDAAAVKPHPAEKFLHLFNWIERMVHLNIVKLEDIDKEY